MPSSFNTYHEFDINFVGFLARLKPVLSALGVTKPYMHMTPEGKSFSFDQDAVHEKFVKLDQFTVSFGFSLGILAYSTVLCQITAVPELMMNEQSY